jgi:hypothetical protein
MAERDCSIGPTSHPSPKASPSALWSSLVWLLWGGRKVVMMPSMVQFRDNRMGSSHYVSSGLSAMKEGYKASIIGRDCVPLGDIKLKLRCLCWSHISAGRGTDNRVNYLLQRYASIKKVAPFLNTMKSCPRDGHWGFPSLWLLHRITWSEYSGFGRGTWRFLNEYNGVNVRFPCRILFDNELCSCFRALTVMMLSSLILSILLCSSQSISVYYITLYIITLWSSGQGSWLQIPQLRE